jgi:hypothetical protein
MEEQLLDEVSNKGIMVGSTPSDAEFCLASILGISCNALKIMLVIHVVTHKLSDSFLFWLLRPKFGSN